MKLQIYQEINPEVLKRLNREGLNLGSIEEQDTVNQILKSIKENGKSAISDFRKRFDRISDTFCKLDSDQIKLAASACNPEIQAAIRFSILNVSKYHAAQKQTSNHKIQIIEGLQCWRKSLAIESVGLYVPGGTAPLFSSLIMLAVPAKLAGCNRIVVCTPPDSNGKLNAEIAFIAEELELPEVYIIGGAQAIGFMAYGCEGIAKVDKIFGPGNKFVTLAKQIVSSQGGAIDLPAGPSEVLIIADKHANPEFVALDLLSQCEHGADSQAILLSDDLNLIYAVQTQIAILIKKLSRASIIEKSLSNCFAALVPDLNQAIELSNIYAPEHLILAVQQAHKLSEAVSNAGSVFIGNYSAEVFGDYLSGPNHTLPTAGFAKTLSGVTLESFCKFVSFQQVSKEAAKILGQATKLLATAEGLDAHAMAAEVRMGDNFNER